MEVERKKKDAIVGECKSALHTQEDKLVCGPVYLFSWITFISVIMFFFLVILASMCCQCIQEWVLIWKKKEIIYVCGGQWALHWGYSITERHILNGKCCSYIYLCFWKENLNKDDCFFTCSISFHHLCWDIPGSPWQGRMCRFPFQTGLSCPSHHQGSLLKYIPSVRAWG